MTTSSDRQATRSAGPSNRRTALVLVLVAAAAAALGLGILFGTADDPHPASDRLDAEAGDPEVVPSAIPGVKQFEVGNRSHVTGTVKYDQSPPVGGDHNPVWANCGFYSDPVPNELAVHSLEHGASWIAYDPSIGDEAIKSLKNLGNQGFTLISPVEELSSPIVVGAWGRQLAVDGVDDPNLQRFIEEFAQGPDTPEPGAPCTGGVGDPA